MVVQCGSSGWVLDERVLERKAFNAKELRVCLLLRYKNKAFL